MVKTTSNLQFMSVSEGYRLSELKFSSFSFTILARTCYFSSPQEFNFFKPYEYLFMWVGVSTFWCLSKNFAQSADTGSVVYRVLGSHENTKKRKFVVKEYDGFYSANTIVR